MLNLFKKNFLLILILVIASGLRLFQLGLVPHGMTWDEAAIGYNGFAIMATRRDEWLERLPVSFKSFGDYKAPAAIYINGLFTSQLKINNQNDLDHLPVGLGLNLGLNLWAVRLPFALAGIATVVLLYALTTELFNAQRNRHEIGLIVAGLATVSPWLIHFSRVGFESGLALLFTILGVWLILKSTRQAKLLSELSIAWIIQLTVGLSSLILAIYSYHSSKIVVPILLTYLLFKLFPQILPHLKHFNLKMVVISLACTACLCLGVYPVLKDSIAGRGLERASVTIFSQTGFNFDSTLQVFHNAALHISPAFLIEGKTDSLRHGTGNYGVLGPVLSIFFWMGLLVVALGKSNSSNQPIGRFILIWLIAGILPAALAPDVPHPNRSLLAAPAFLIISFIGLEFIYSLLKAVPEKLLPQGSKDERHLLMKSVMGTAMAVHILWSVGFVSDYFIKYSARSTEDFSDGYLEAFNYVNSYVAASNSANNKVDTILFTSDYGQPYIYALFTKKTNPIWYQGGSLNHYQFTDKIVNSDLDRFNTIIVSSGQKPLDVKPVHIVYGADKSVRFLIYKSTNWKANEVLN